MPNPAESTGSCLCGEVSFTASNVGNSVGACHCSMCRKWGGGPFLELNCGSDISFEGEENISVFDSSQWADRGFCKRCGTHLFYRLKEVQQYMVPVGLFEGDDKALVFDHQVFIDEKPHYYGFENKTEDMTGEEVFAKYAPQE